MDTEKIKLRADLQALASRVEGVDALERAMPSRIDALERAMPSRIDALGQALASRIEGVEALGQALASRVEALEQAAKEDAARKAQRLSWMKKKQPSQPERPAQEGAA